jgi:hypothetical protein
LLRVKENLIVEDGGSIRTEFSHMMRAVLIATSLAVEMPCFAQQVRVISGDIEHIYGPGGQLLDSPELQERNQRAWERMQAEKQLVIERRKADVEMERLKLQEAAALAYAPYSDAPMSDSYGGWGNGGGFIGSTQGMFRRGVIGPRTGMISQRIGGSSRMGGGSRR